MRGGIYLSEDIVDIHGERPLSGGVLYLYLYLSVMGLVSGEIQWRNLEVKPDWLGSVGSDGGPAFLQTGLRGGV